MKKCIYCGAPLDDDSLFCTNCGKKLEPQGRYCPRCGSFLDEDSVFCVKCGTRLEKKSEDSQIPLQNVSEPDVEPEKIKNRKTLYIVGGIAIAALLIFCGILFYNKVSRCNEEQEVVLSAEEEAVFVDLVHKWDEMHCKGWDIVKKHPYADSVFFYGKRISGNEAAKEIQNALKSRTTYTQESSSIKVTRISDRRIVCDFNKHTNSDGRTHDYLGCYLFYTKVDEGNWKVEEESDILSDSILQRMREKQKNDVIVCPLTLQFIREYCDYLMLPYRYWDFVEKDIKEYKLNILTYEGPSWDAQPRIVRGRVAMNYKYKDGNTILDNYSNYDNYINFCDAIGGIKDVWKVIPVNIEGNGGLPFIQFKYDGNGLENTIISAKYVEDGVDDYDSIPIYHYEYYRDDNKEKVIFDIIEY